MLGSLVAQSGLTKRHPCGDHEGGDTMQFVRAGFVIGLLASGTLTLVAETVRLSQQFPSRVLMRSGNGFSIDWSSTFDHVAVYRADGSLAVSYYPQQTGIVFHRIADAALLPDGGFILGGTLVGSVSALVFVNPKGVPTNVVRVHPGYIGKLARSADGRLWTVGRSPVRGDLNVVSVFSAEGRLLFTSVSPTDLPVSPERLQLGNTYLVPWRGMMLWVLPEHRTVLALSGSGGIAKRIRLEGLEASDLTTGAWQLGDKLVLAFLPSDQSKRAVAEVDLTTGRSRTRELAGSGFPVGIWDGKLVRYSRSDGTLIIEPYPTGAVGGSN
jgi:hypothetical protein